MLSAGLTLIFSMMGVLNFAHASFYMLGAYLGYTFSGLWGFWWGLLLAPAITGLLGVFVERFALRRLHAQGQLAELLFTFGLAYLIVEVVQLTWGRLTVPYAIPESLQGALFLVYSSTFSLYRAFMALIALVMLAVIYLSITRTRIGLVIQAALTQPTMVEALGHNVPRIFMWVFGTGCSLAGLAGAVGGNAFVTEPGMAASVGSIIFVVVVLGGVGSLAGAFWASLLIACVQTFAVTLDVSLLSLIHRLGGEIQTDHFAYGLLSLNVSQIAPILPFLMLILMLVWRPRGMMGTHNA
ncbi:branched-chain amino acid ABC transporter permease [Undibacterium sp. Di24W]|uniref:branched-chain amino acid ABC transporter permease n=1 Tax=Undibacterium sp. Di24W TaxID=3413033 RepID=UPI003BF01421